MKITVNSAGIRGLAGTCEDEEEKADYLGRLDEITGKPGFKDAIHPFSEPTRRKSPSLR